MYHFMSFISVLYYAIVSVRTMTSTSAFSASVFIFFDEGNRLVLNNEITTLRFWCSGCIVAPRLILTTAACFNTKGKELTSESYIVVPSEGATTFENSKTQPYEVEKIILNTNSDSANNDANVALLLLKQVLNFSNNINKVHLPLHAIKKKQNCTSMLWMREPSNKSKGVLFKPHLLSGETDITCKGKKKNEYEFCFISKVNDDSCYDVQGSILTCNDVLQGIASSQYGGADPFCPDKKNSTYLNILYINVNLFNEWVTDHIYATLYELPSTEDTDYLDDRSETDNVRYSKVFEVLLLFLMCLL